MRRILLAQLLLLALAVTAAACSDDNATSVTTPVAPTGSSITETFAGTLNTNGAASFPFASTTSGSISASLTTFTPDTTLQIGLWIGVWDGARCSSGVANDKAIQGTTVTGFATTSGNWCVRIYDATGTVTQVENYQIDVTHP